MLKRVSALCALGLAAGALLLQAQDVFVLPGAGSGNEAVEAFTANNGLLSQIATFNAGNGSFLVLPTADASKFFVIADAAAQTVTSADATFSSPLVVANLPAPATAAVLTPDGSLLAVAAGNLYMFNTATSDQTVSGGFSQGFGVNTFDVAASLDASTLYALGSTTSGASQLTAFSIATTSVAATITIPQLATAVSVGPNGLVYVSLPNEILELDPRTLKTTAGGEMGLTGTPGRLVFTPDGQSAVAVNQSQLVSSTLLTVALATHTVTAPNLGVPPLSGLQVTGLHSVGGFANQFIYQITVSGSVSVAELQIPGVGVLGFTASNEVPTSALPAVRDLYAVTSTALEEINPATNAITSHYLLAPSVVPGALSFAAPASAASQSNIATLVTYGANQSILPGASSEPLVVQVLDKNNHPVRDASVKFQSSVSNASLSSIFASTGASGYALTYLTAPATAGPITVTATVGSLTANFSVDVTSTAGGASSPILSIVAGQGQLLNADTSTEEGLQFGSPLEVLVTDSNKNPLPGVPVTFSVPTAGGTLIVSGSGGPVQTVNTNADGTAQVAFLTTSPPANSETGFIQASVTVSAPGTNSVIFYITTVPQIPSPSVYFLSPTPGAKLTGTAGGTLAGAVSAAVYSSIGLPIPNVSLTLDDGNLDPSTAPTVSCNAPSGGAVLTTTNGQATCNVVFGPRVGSGTATASIGYTRSSYDIPFTVTAGAAAVVQITQGNNQVGNPGQTLPLALVIHVTDSGGNTVGETPITWQVLTPGAVTLANQSSVTDSSGDASAIATLGSIGGIAQVQVTVGGASAVFNFTVNIPSAALQKISGDQQTAAINTTFQLPLTVQVVNSSGGAVPGVQVNFQVTSGVATLGASSATTGSNGQASTTVVAGGTGGAITVTASSAGFSVTFTLNAQLPGPSDITVVNGASFAPGTGISPGGIATISGAGFLTGVEGLVTADNIVGPLPTTLGGVTVTFGAAGTPAPIYYVQNANGADQVTVQVPFEVQPGSSVALTVSVANGGSTTVFIPVKPFAPGIFTTVYGGKTYPIALRPDGSFVSPTNPVQPGENISVYVTGLGPVTPPSATGDAGVPGQSMVPNAKGAPPLIVGLNDSGVPLISADYAPGLVGVFVITLQVPADAKTGPYQPLGIVAFDSANNAYFANSTYLPIQ